VFKVLECITIGSTMSARNGDKSRYQINRKRGVLRRAKVRRMLAETRRAGSGRTEAKNAKT
jgi:hypothetical protein